LNPNAQGAGAGSKKNKKDNTAIIPESSESLISEESKVAARNNLDKIQNNLTGRLQTENPFDEF
jgi:hypothetical protein